MSDDEEHLAKIRRYFQRIGVQPETFLQLHGYTPAQGAAYIEAIEAEILQEFEALRHARSDLLAITECQRQELESIAQQFGTTFERELASSVVMRARLEAQFATARTRRFKVSPSDFPSGQLPPGIDDIIPSDLIDDNSPNT